MNATTTNDRPATSASPAAPALDPEIDALGPWFHNLHLPDGTQTCPDHWLGDFPQFTWQQVADHLPADLTGWTCLDIGCNAGFYTFELAKRGGTVLGIDLDPHYLRQAEWARHRFPDLAHRVRFECMQVYDLAHYQGSGFRVQGSGNAQSAASAPSSPEPRTPNPEPFKFDLVLFMGVLYHLRYPLLGLDIVAQKVNRLMLFQTLTMPGDAVFQDTHGHDFNNREVLLDAGWPKMAFLEHHFAGDPTNWWAPNDACVEAMLRSSGMRVVGRSGHEIYLCEPDHARPSCVATWNAAEFLAATGRPWRQVNQQSDPQPSGGQHG